MLRLIDDVDPPLDADSAIGLDPLRDGINRLRERLHDPAPELPPAPPAS